MRKAFKLPISEGFIESNTKKTYKLPLSERFTGENSQNPGARIKSLLETMFPGTDGWEISVHDYGNTFYRWFIRVSRGLVSGFVIRVSVPQNNKMFIKIYEESKYTVKFNVFIAITLMVTFAGVMTARLYSHGEKWFLVALIYSVLLLPALVIIKKITRLFLTVILGKKISGEEIVKVAANLKEHMR